MAAHTANAPATPADEDSPYHQGYNDGYAAGQAYAWSNCSVGSPYEGYKEGAYWSGYSDGWYPGNSAGYEKYCRA